MKLRRIFLLTICALAALSVNAQSLEQIKSSNKYYWGEGKGKTINEARALSYEQLTLSIAAAISVKTTDEAVRTEINGKATEEARQETMLQVSSRIHLSNYETRIISEAPGDCHVLLYISKDKYAEQQQKICQVIKDYIKAGTVAERRLQIDDALRNYYWGLALDKYNDLHVPVELGETTGDCQTLVPLKIRSVLKQLTATPQPTEKSELGTYPILVNFSYAGNPVSTLTFHYFDGESWIGPATIVDGRGETELIKLPNDNRVNIRYEYRFDDQMDNPDLTAALAMQDLPIFDASRYFSLKVNERKGTLTAGNEPAPVTPQEELMPAEPKRAITTTQLKQIASNRKYLAAMQQIELAITQSDPTLAMRYFTDEGFRMFANLLGDKKAKVKLESPHQTYEFVDDSLGQILARPCRVIIKYPGRKFSEKLVFRFDKRNDKICSMAYMLSDAAMEDIFNSKAKWADISRYTILEFMENYQTAYAQKNLDFISKIFSDQAIIILGTVLQTAEVEKGKATMLEEGRIINLGHGRDGIRYSSYTKKQYLNRLAAQFKDRDYIHLRFEENKTGIINAPHIQDGDAFSIQIKQTYNSPHYSDQGYLTLLLNMRGENGRPMIEVRLWQPDKDKECVDPVEFFSAKNFRM